MTTNNRMELTAAIMALEALKPPLQRRPLHRLPVRAAGHYGLDANWKARGWRTADNKPVKNEDLWRRLDAARARHQVAWRWVRGHAGDPRNERVDALARSRIAEQRAKRWA